MELHTLPRFNTKGKRRLGQGHGSGRSKTAGRGTKGQLARNTVPLTFEGGALSLIKRLPFRRGKSRNYSIKAEIAVLNVGDLKVFAKDEQVTIASLQKHNLLTTGETAVKILGDGDVTVPLTVLVPATKSAKEKIENAGGKVESTVS